MIKINKISEPFIYCCQKVIPLAFDESMSYYECLCNLRYKVKEVIDELNSQGLAIEELQEKYLILVDYVEHYFDNLDVQEEINNKLDEMAEDGTLENIISQYIELMMTYTYNNVEEMKEATNLVEGSYARTSGYYNYNDGGGAYYLIKNSSDNYHENLDNGLVAELINNVANVKQYGAKGDNLSDDTNAFNQAILSGKNVYIPSGTYIITETLSLPSNTIILGEDINKVTISKASETVPNAIFNFTGNGNVKIDNISLECNNVVDYGILSNVNISKFKLSNIKINRPVTAGIYTNKSTYLGIIEKVTVTNTSGTGFYLVPVDKNSYTNTSINLINCYCSECNNAYAIDGSYMNMDNCACDGIYHIAYDLRGYIGSLISCGSEAYYVDYMFYGDHFTNATIVNAQTFATYDKAGSTHIFTGVSSTWVFIGGKLAIPFRTTNPKGLGRFLEQSEDSHIKFIGTEVRGSFTKPSILTSGLEVNDNIGSVFNKGDMLYIGYNSTEFGDEISTNKIPTNAIYLGSNNAPYVINNSKSNNRGVNSGDVFISKTPEKIGGLGWISNTDYVGSLPNGTYYKIPVVKSGATGSEQTRGLVVGDMYFDTTLNEPKWLINIGRQQQETLAFSTAPSNDGTITITFNGTNYEIPVVAGMTKSQLYQALLNANIEGLIIEEWNSSVACTSKDYKNYGGSMFSINEGDTGATLSKSTQISGANPQWKKLSDFVGS